MPDRVGALAPTFGVDCLMRGDGKHNRATGILSKKGLASSAKEDAGAKVILRDNDVVFPMLQALPGIHFQTNLNLEKTAPSDFPLLRKEIHPLSQLPRLKGNFLIMGV